LRGELSQLVCGSRRRVPVLVHAGRLAVVVWIVVLLLHRDGSLLRPGGGRHRRVHHPHPLFLVVAAVSPLAAVAPPNQSKPVQAKQREERVAKLNRGRLLAQGQSSW
jgi:hypothetical protein